MSSPIPPESSQMLIAGYVLGDLTPEEAVAFEQLLSEHPEMAQDIAQLQDALELTYGSAPVSPPAHLRSQILQTKWAQVDARTSETDSSRLTSPSSHPAREAPRTSEIPWGKIWGIAAAIAIAALGVSNYVLWRSLRTWQTAQDPTVPADSLTYRLAGTETTPGASAQIRVNPTMLEGQFIAENLPPLPDGKVYVLWTVLDKDAPFTTDAKGAILTQVFEVDEAGYAFEIITLPPVYQTRDWITKVAITVEDAAQPQVHQGAIALVTSTL